MNRRGFLGALTAVLATLGVTWPAPRSWMYTKWIRTPFKTATETETVLNAGWRRVELRRAQIEELHQGFRWSQEKVLLPAEDHLRFFATVPQDIICPEHPERWKAGDIWLNLETREPLYVIWVDRGMVKVMRSVGGNPATLIMPADRLMLVGSDGREFS